MVIICPDNYDNQIQEYQSYFDSFPFPLSPFQKYAIQGVVDGNHVLVTAHTGSGKTLPAEFSIRHFVGQGKKVIYTTPIKALSNQKYYEFTNKYPDIKFGLFTGDIKTNPEADVLIMTTEILMNRLFQETVGNDSEEGKEKINLQFNMDIQNELGCVIFDEVHYINDEERGQVWEKTILMLPLHIQMVMLSATIDNPAGFAEWIENRDSNSSTKKLVVLASTNHRVVPLSHYTFLTVNESTFKGIKDKTLQQEVRNHTNRLIDLQDANGNFYDVGYHNTNKYRKYYVDVKRKNVLNQLSLFLRDREMLPAIAFVFSRKNVEKCAKEITVPLLEDDSKIPYIIRRESEQILRKLPNFSEYLELPEYQQLVGLLEKGIGIHHSGMIPVLREIVELMISKKYIKLLFATESFAIGLDCPIKTTIFTSLTKFDGNGERFLMAHEYTQMAGRAGRRGIDTIGYVVHCNNLFPMPTITDYKKILGGVPQKLVSKFRISYGLILNLLKNGQKSDFHLFSERSMVLEELMKDIECQIIHIKELDILIDKKRENFKLKKTSENVCMEYLELEEKFKVSFNKKRKECERMMQCLKDDNHFLLQDLESFREIINIQKDIHNEKDIMNFQTKWIVSQSNSITKILLDDCFIFCVNEPDVSNDFVHFENKKYEMTQLGKIASCIAEVHPLILSRRLVDSSFFKYLNVRELVGLFSCFTNIKISNDLKKTIPPPKESLTIELNCLLSLSNYYESKELEFQTNTGIHYYDLLMFDIVDYSMEWCNCENEQQCKYFIQNIISEKGISVGDFTKAMMKIVTISKELEGICETFQEMDLLFKLKQIDGLVLKYVLTSQSLYI